MSVGILGGSFNPVHQDHLTLSCYVKKALNLDRIVLVPNANPPHKQSCTVPFDIRFDMLKIATHDLQDFEISAIEKEQSIHHYSFNTISELKKQYTEKIYFIMGTDSLNYLDKWYRGLELTDLCSLVVLQRNGYSIEQANAEVLEYLKDKGVNESDPLFSEKLNSKDNYCFILNKELNEVSSSALRDEFKKFYDKFSDSITLENLYNNSTLFPLVCRFLDREVVNYILQKGLYSS